jgi:translation elongation factor EF-G
MKKIFFVFFITFAFNLSASVYDIFKLPQSDFPVFNALKTGKMKVRINNNKMDISLFEINKPSKQILDLLYEKAEKNNCVFYNNETVLYIADLLYKIAGKRRYDDEFGYIFYKDNKNRMNFTICAGDGQKSEIIKITSNSFNTKKVKGFDDGIKHFSDIEKILSIEILSDADKTIYFANFYRAVFGDRYEIRNFYNNSLKNNKFKIIKKYFDNETDFFILEKNRKNYFFAITEQNNENWIMVAG